MVALLRGPDTSTQRALGGRFRGDDPLAKLVGRFVAPDFGKALITAATPAVILVT